MRFFIHTFGCQMNVYDSARLADTLRAAGGEPVSTAEDADLVVVNTCHIRRKASEKAFSELGRYKMLKNTDGVPRLVLAGCIASALGDEVFRRAPWVDAVVGPADYHRVMELLEKGERRAVVTGTSPDKFSSLPPPGPREISAFLAIQEGCDNRCAYCVVPTTRGPEYSRPAADILSEARRLVQGGVREVTLLGQNVDSWHGAAEEGGIWRLGRLIREIAQQAGPERIRYATSHPRDMDEDLITAHRDVPELMPYVHLPIQSGASRILKAMNRHYTVAEYLSAVNRLREVRPDIAISSDFIVGFPGETDEDFQDTCDLVDRVGFAHAYSFAFSPRPGTPAAEMTDTLPKAEASRRLQILQEKLAAARQRFNAPFVGREIPVLLDRKGTRPGQLAGRSPWMQAVHLPAPEFALGTVVSARILGVGPNSLTGTAVSTPRKVS